MLSLANDVSKTMFDTLKTVQFLVDILRLQYNQLQYNQRTTVISLKKGRRRCCAKSPTMAWDRFCGSSNENSFTQETISSIA